jgi:TRAP-type mannitol/chloroaromatic compound transport system substrate-binding protein
LLQNPDIEVREFPKEVMHRFRQLSAELLDELAERDPAAAKIMASFDEFRRISTANQRIGVDAFLETRD